LLKRFGLLQGLFSPYVNPPTVEPTTTPVLLGHSSNDDVISVDYGVRMKDMLGKLGFQVEWHEYADGGHWINTPQGIDHFVEFLRKRTLTT